MLLPQGICYLEKNTQAHRMLRRGVVNVVAMVHAQRGTKMATVSVRKLKVYRWETNSAQMIHLNRRCGEG